MNAKAAFTSASTSTWPPSPAPPALPQISAKHFHPIIHLVGAERRGSAPDTSPVNHGADTQ